MFKQIVRRLSEVGGAILFRSGGAKLVRREDGSHEVLGGSSLDRVLIREWVSLFGHDVIVDTEIVSQTQNHRRSRAACRSVRSRLFRRSGVL